MPCIDGEEKGKQLIIMREKFLCQLSQGIGSCEPLSWNRGQWVWLENHTVESW